MLDITKLNGEAHLLTNVHQVQRKRKVNGEKTISFNVLPDAENAHAWESVANESLTTFQGEPYTIKGLGEKSMGSRSIKQVDAVHSFFTHMMDCYQENVYSGSQTFAAALSMVFEKTTYSFSIVDSFNAKTLENFGASNCLAMFQKVLESYGSEFRIVGKQVYLQRQIGADTGFQFRWDHNVKAIDKNVDTKNLATYIKGYGKLKENADELVGDARYMAIAEHTSPNAALYPNAGSPDGLRHAGEVYDERFVEDTALLAEIKSRLQDEPELSITVDIAELGLKLGTLNEGDRGYIIYEPMGIKVGARIVEIDETFEYIDDRWVLIKTAVTLSNSMTTLTDITTRFAETSKRVDRLFSGLEKVPFNALNEAVIQATRDLQSAQTQLTFNNGIIGIDPNNPNLLTAFTSAGVGISNDGGATFQNALTGNGLVATVITSGQINANNVSIGNNNVLLDSTGLGVYSGSTLTAKLTGGYLNFYDYLTGESVGRFQSSFLGGSPETKGISLNLDNNKYISFGYYKDAEFGYQRLMSINADLYSTNAGKFGVNFLSDGHLNGRTLYFDDIGNTTGIRTALTNDAQGTPRRVLAMLGNAGAYMMDVDGVMGSGTETYSKRIGFFEDNNYLFGPAGEIGNTRSYTDFWMGDRSLRFGIDQFHNQSAIYNSANNDLIIASYGGIGLSYIGAGGATSSRLTVDSNSVDIWQDLDMHGWKIINSSTINDIIARLNAIGA